MLLCACRDRCWKVATFDITLNITYMMICNHEELHNCLPLHSGVPIEECPQPDIVAEDTKGSLKPSLS